MTREEKRELAIDILSIAAATGFLALTLAAPGILVLAPLFRNGRRIPKRELGPAIDYARKRRWLHLTNNRGQDRLVLTEQGKRRLVTAAFGSETIRRPKHWDGKWRVVIFDIPEKKKVVREVVRDALRRLGFRKLQKSVWIHPFPCERVIADLAHLYEGEKYISTLVVQRFDRESIFLHKFDLTKNRISATAEKLIK